MMIVFCFDCDEKEDFVTFMLEEEECVCMDFTTKNDQHEILFFLVAFESIVD